MTSWLAMDARLQLWCNKNVASSAVNWLLNNQVKVTVKKRLINFYSNSHPKPSKTCLHYTGQTSDFKILLLLIVLDGYLAHTWIIINLSVLTYMLYIIVKLCRARTNTSTWEFVENILGKVLSQDISCHNAGGLVWSEASLSKDKRFGELSHYSCQKMHHN